MFLSIITATYNRAHYLERLANSIIEQSSSALSMIEWIVIDDGSQDETKSLVHRLINKYQHLLSIQYEFQANQGKHSAINTGVGLCRGEYVMIIDSDDLLVSGALERLIKDVSESQSVVTAFLYGNNQHQFAQSYYDVNEYLGLKGDKALVFRKHVLQSHPFPVFKHERFVTESVVWNRIMDAEPIHCINVTVTTGAYLTDGLSSQYLSLLSNNPRGVMALVETNMGLKEFGLNVLKQTAYHFSTVVSMPRCFSLLKKYPLFKSSLLIVSSYYVAFKRRARKR
ncbi:glycosyltransferase family 2 protein [Vibrio aestuarianus]|uniref:glycosyltransferase family 2 protein n=1 Tax=Vibrio aestuarianus TaxID=28171 RepID=UPI00237CB2F6|nr:glycosyltransferase family A protein [Vibrio aestuarianus]MDE1330732.1 glycosyltransferase family 2 protein [Vibrio aestuarianus]